MLYHAYASLCFCVPADLSSTHFCFRLQRGIISCSIDNGAKHDLFSNVPVGLELYVKVRLTRHDTIELMNNGQ